MAIASDYEKIFAEEKSEKVVEKSVKIVEINAFRPNLKIHYK